MKPVEMQAPQHDAADMGEKSESLQCMTIIWTAFCLVFSVKLQSKQFSACASVASSDVLRVRAKQMGNEAQARHGGRRESLCMACLQLAVEKMRRGASGHGILGWPKFSRWAVGYSPS